MAYGSAERQPSGLLRDAVAARTVADLAALLRALRRRDARRRGGPVLTYRVVAERTGWSVTAVAEYFTGTTLPPTDRFDILVGLLGADPAEQGALATARDRVDEHRRDGRGAVSTRAGGGRAGRGQAGGAPVPRQLPPAIGHFGGRRAELAELTALAAQAAGTVVIAAIAGTAGVGKTTLAVHAAHRLAGGFPDGQLYLNLRGFDPSGQVMAPAEALRRFLDALGVPAERIPADLDAQAALYRSLLARRRVLILLDNARDAAQVRPLLPGAPACLVLVTSRNRLPGLVAVQGAHPITLDLLTTGEAVELLARRLGTARVTAEPAAVEQIITRCARLPLALAVVAARAAAYPQLALHTLADQLASTHPTTAHQTSTPHQLGSPHPLGTPGQVSAPGQVSTAERCGSRTGGDPLEPLTGDTDPHTDLAAVFSWSYTALTSHAAGLFRLLALHPGADMSAQAAASLTALPVPRVRALLAELVAVGLLGEPTPGRYGRHDLLRAYAAGLSTSADPEHERRAATLRLLDHYTHTAHAAARLLDPTRDPSPLPLAPPAGGCVPERLSDERAALDWLTAEQQALLATLQLAASAGYDTHAWQLPWALDVLLHRRGRWTELTSAWQVAVDAADRLADPAAGAFAHRAHARASTQLGRYRTARAHLGRALTLHARAGDRAGQAHTHRALAILCERQGRPGQALDHAEQALALYRAAGDRRGQANALNAVGWCHALLGSYAQARDCCAQALALHQQSGDRDGAAATWDSLGYAHHHLAEHAAAADCYRHALSLFRELGDRYQEATTWTNLGDTHRAGGDHRAAADAWRQAITILDALDHPDAAHVRDKLAALDHPAAHQAP